MTQEERWAQIQSTLMTISADVAVIKNEMHTIKEAVDDHEDRLRELEKEQRNNTLVRRATTFVVVVIFGTIVSVSGSLILKLVGK